MSGFTLIKGQVQPYQWGGFDFIPKLLSQNTSAQPCAEYWLGDHPSAPSTISNGSQIVTDYLASHSAPHLKFLFKILDVKEMLSIQSHPTKQQAKAGFDRENKLGISLSAKNRNYKDECDKPELMVALSTFWLLHGIKPIEEIEKSLVQKTYLEPLLKVLQEQGLKSAFAIALDKENHIINDIHKSLIDDFSRSSTTYSKSDISFWIARWIQLNPDTANGILTLFFLNIVKLETGEAIYQPPGLLHAYLEGQNVELMANSDNVLRAGLTPKHIDVNELLNTCDISSSEPQKYIIQQKVLANKSIEYTTPFEDFVLEELSSARANTIEWTARNSEILFCYQGKVTLEDANKNKITIYKGDAVLILPNTSISAQLDDALIYKASNI